MKKVVSSSIIALFIILLASAGFFYFRKYRTAGGDPVKAIPADAAWVCVWYPDSSSINSALSLQSWNALIKAPLSDRLHRNLQMMDSLFKTSEEFSELVTSSPIYISAHTTGAGTFDFLFMQSMSGYRESDVDDVFLEIAGNEFQLTRRNYDGNSIREIPFADGNLFAYTFSKGVFIGGFTSFLVEDALRQNKVGKPVLHSWITKQLTDNSDGLKLVVLFQNLATFASGFTADEGNVTLNSLKKFASWSTGDVYAGEQGITVSGLVKGNDSLLFQGVIRKQEPVSCNMLKILPEKTSYILWNGFTNAELYIKNSVAVISDEQFPDRSYAALKGISRRYGFDFREKIIQIAGNELALVITEPSGIDFTNQCFAILNTSEKENAKEILRTLSNTVSRKNNTSATEEKYNGHIIGLIRITGMPEAVFGPQFRKVKNLYYSLIGEYVVFANQAASLRLFIDDFESGRLLHKSKGFSEAVEGLAQKANHFLYLNPATGRNLFKSVIHNSWKPLVDEYKDVIRSCSGIAYQVCAGSPDNTFGLNIRFDVGKPAPGVLRLLAIDADSSVSGKIAVTTGSDQRVIFQDNSGSLFCTDATGSVIWKKDGIGEVTSPVYEADLFRNGKQQFLFNTAEYLHMLDASGMPAGNYPIRLPAPATNPITYSDANGDGEPEIYVACTNGRVYAYELSGKPLSGWVYNLTTGRISKPLTALTVNGRRTLILSDDNGLTAILHPNGELMYPAIQNIFISKYSNAFSTPDQSIVTTDTAGNVIEILQGGIVKNIEFGKFGTSHGFSYIPVDDNPDPDYVFVTGNELSVYNREKKQLFKVSFEGALEPEINSCRTSDGKTLLIVRSAQAGKIWLVQNDGTIYPGFPVPGCGPVTVLPMKEDGTLRLYTGGCQSAVHVYSAR